jgi:hypothetical protein
LTNRIPLRAQLADAWRNTINAKYRGQLINSERGLQVYFCSELLRIFRSARVKRRLFIEPRVSAKGAQEYRHPDIVICNDVRIIGVVELKYGPRAAARYKKDLETFDFVTSRACGLTISNDRFLGRTIADRPYPLAPDAVLCWAGVYRGPAIHLRTRIKSALRAQFLQLDALTAKGQDPVTLVDGNEGI